MSNSDLLLPSSPGSYLLILYLRKQTAVQVGRLGNFSFRRGWYFYAGSAFGPGGLQGRLSHHLRPLRQLHWHIDYLRSAAELRAFCYQLGVNNEHRWAAALGTLDPTSFPVHKFGASDCLCQSHLLYSPRFLSRKLLADTLGISFAKIGNASFQQV